MFKRLLMFFVDGKMFRMIQRRSQGRGFRSSGWGSRHASGHGSLSNLSNLFGRRRRSFL